MIKKILVSIFVVLNISCVLIANETDLAVRLREAVARRQDPMTAYRIRRLDWMVRTYAFMAGLDNYWTLFSYLPRFNYWYVITAKYTDGGERLLPLPLQGRRSFFQRYFFDFRAAKYYLNIYNRQDAMERYGRYLCRTFPENNGAPVVSVNIELYYQNIFPREVAREQGTTVESQANHRSFSRVSCVGPR